MNRRRVFFVERGASQRRCIACDALTAPLLVCHAMRMEHLTGE